MQDGLKEIEIQGVGRFQVPASYTDEQVAAHIKELRRKNPAIFARAKAVKPEAPAPTFMSRLMQSVPSVEGLKTIGEAALSVYPGVGQVLGGPNNPKLQAIARGVYDSSKSRLQKAKEEFGTSAQLSVEGKPVQSFLSSMAGLGQAGAAIPLLGEGAGEIGEDLGGGNVGAAAGGATAMLGPDLLLRGTGKLASRLKDAGKAPIPLTVSEKTGSRAAAIVEGFAEKAIPSAGRFSKFRQSQQEAIQNLAKEVGDEISASPVRSSEEAGRMVQESLIEAKNQIRKQTAIPYEEVEELVKPTRRTVMSREARPSSLVDEFGRPSTYEAKVPKKVMEGGVQPSTKSLKRAAVPILRRIRAQAELMDPKFLSDAESILGRIISAPEKVPFTVMHDVRSDLLAISRSPGLDTLLPGKRAGIINRMADAADRAMTAAAAESGIPGLAKKISDAHANTREMHRIFDKKLIEQIATTDRPEIIAGYFKNAAIDDVRDLEMVLPQDKMDVVRRQIFKDAVEDATSGELKRAGSIESLVTQGTMQDATPMFSGKKFQGFLEKLGEDKLKTLYGDKYNLIVDFNRLTNSVGKGNVQSIVASMYNFYLMGSAAALPTGKLGAINAAGAAGSAAAVNIASRIVTSQDAMVAFKRAMTGTGRVPSRSTLFWATRMAQAVNKQEDSEE